MRFKLAGILNTEELFNFKAVVVLSHMKTTCRFFQYMNLSLSLSLYIYKKQIPTFITEKVKGNEAFS